jgi:hypothetical protein
MLGAVGPEIMYCGDHLYADVVRQEATWHAWCLSYCTVIPLQNFILHRQLRLFVSQLFYQKTPDYFK